MSSFIERILTVRSVLNGVFAMKWIYMGGNGVKRNKYKFLISNKDGENVQKLYDI